MLLNLFKKSSFNQNLFKENKACKSNKTKPTNIFYLLTFVLFFFSEFIIDAHQPDFLFRKISPDGGFTYGFINSITEDENGFIWFGTKNGLYQYNSKEVKVFQYDKENPNSIISNYVLSLLTTKDKTLWIVTNKGLCRYNYASGSFVSENFIDEDSLGLNSSIHKIIENGNNTLFSLHIQEVCQIKSNKFEVLDIPYEDGDIPSTIYFDHSDILWIGTNQGRIYKSFYPYDKFIFVCKKRNNSIRTICEDNNSLWVGYEWGGVDHISTQGAVIKHYTMESHEKNKLPHNRVRKIIKDNLSNIWIATYQGIYIITRDGNRLIQADNYNQLPHNSISELFIDSNEGIWIGSWSGGIAYYNNNDNRFLHFKMNSEINSLQSNNISAFTEDKDNNIWIASEDEGILLFDRDELSFTKFNIKNGTNFVTNIKSLAYSKNNGLWVGTLFNGLWYIDLETKEYKKYDLFDNDKIRIYSLLEDDEGIWIGSYGYGLFYYDYQTRTTKSYLTEQNKSKGITSSLVRAIYKDSYEGLWIGTYHGLFYKPFGSSNFEKFYHSTEEPFSTNNDEINSILEDSQGLIWIGTENGIKCFLPEKKEFIVYGKKEGLSGDIVYGILEDRSKRLWISTENGLSCINPANKSIKNFDTEDGTQGKQFNPGSSFKCKNGELMFGGSNGFNLIAPSALKENKNPPKVIITELLINNAPADEASKENSLKSVISVTDNLNLKHFQNTLTFEFVSSNFIQPEKNEFKYRLLNYDDSWIYTGNENKASFTKIPPGKYTLEVKGSNNSGVWSEPKRLLININPPFWATWYAYLFYFLMTFSLAWYVSREILAHQKLKKQLMYERIKNENDEKLFQLKMKFFTNITHEFRTPLTLILAPLENIIRNYSRKDSIGEHLEMIKRNAIRLKILINQIIDFRKLELGKSELHKTQFDLIKLCSDIYHTFESYAKDRNINFEFLATNPVIELNADLDKIEKIIFNLLSNAFKYTPEKGEIKLKVNFSSNIESNINLGFVTNNSIKGKGVEIIVGNTGSVIPENEIPLLFKRFYNRQENANQGTGIGLHICNEYTQLHEGSILLNSKDEETQFKLILPIDNNITENDSNEPEIIKKVDFPNNIIELPENKESKKSKTVLIVEDNVELLKYLKMTLKHDYNVLTTENGKKGIELANEFLPNIIISDVLMPEVDGFILCRKIKQNLETSHIPIILLTALSETNNKIEGLNYGADAYLEKPFDEQLIRVQIKNLLDSRERLQKSFTESIDQWKIDSSALPFDKQLVEKAIKIVEEHLLDENFTVEILAAKLNFSRSSLHRKLGVLTNQTATEFIRSVRLNKAIVLMRQGNYNIEEVSYAVGFNSPSYFSQSFKKHFNKSPKSFLKEIDTNDSDALVHNYTSNLR